MVLRSLGSGEETKVIVKNLLANQEKQRNELRRKAIADQEKIKKFLQNQRKNGTKII